MAKQIARLLKTNMMADIDMPALAQFLQSQGRKGDSVLAHINPKEAALLQKMGGAGTENPVTGLPEFYSYGYSPSDYASETDLYSNKYSGGDFDDARIQAVERRDSPRTIRLRNETRNFDDFNIVPYTPQPNDVPAPSMGDPEAPRYSPTEPSNRIFAQPSQRTTISPSYLTDYNIKGAGDFGTSPAMANTAFTPTVPTRSDTYFSTAPGRPDYARENFLPRTAEEQFALERMDVGAERGAQPGEENFLRRGIEGLKSLTGLSGSELAQLGLAGGLGIQGALASRQMAEQGEEARREQEAIAAPYRERGAALLAQAESGQLTPQAQQSLQAMRARLAQGAEARGGVGAQQVAAQVEAFRQQLLANQYDYGMKVSNIGDNLMLGAIRTGLEADRYATQMTNNYYTNMARILGGMGQDTEAAVQQGNQIQQQVRGVR
jgi:hypothetical protein